MSDSSGSPIGAVFDWDGVIIDSHRQHEESWVQLATELGQPPLPESFFKTTFGMRNVQIIPEFTPWAEPGDTEKIAELGDRKELLYRELVRKEGITPLAGVTDLLKSLREAEIPCSVGSSTPRANIDAVIELAGLADYFSAITAAEDVSQGKPDPEVFVLAAKKIDRSSSRCVVFEDAHVGLQAARAAGSPVIAVATTHPADSLTEADLVVETLESVGVDDLIRLIG